MSSREKSFGRRKPPERPATIPPAPDAASAATVEPGGFSIPAPVRGILFALGAIAFVACCYFAAMKGFGKALDRHWSENVGFPSVEDAYKRTAGNDKALEAAHNDCKSRSDFVRLDPKTARALEGFDGLYSGEAAVAKAAQYVSCLTTHSPSRFCRSGHRAHLVAALNDYYRLIAKVREERMMAMAGPFALDKSALINSPGRRGAAGAAPSAETDPRIVAGLRALLADGYMARRDFGWSMPGDLDGLLRDAEPKRSACS